ncbi:MAG TPA: hypothetical protein VE549_11970 [Myxococcaceae bacterium]|nr:hypothetical protein [Myxococcaceae bacterium]
MDFQVEGMVMLAAATVFAARATRFRRRSDVLASSVPSAIEGAVDAMQRGAGPVVGIFSGRIGADGEVMSPAGVRCAFYDATVRRRFALGSRIVALARDSRPLLWIRGERAHARLAFSARDVHAAEEERRVSASGGLRRERLANEAVSRERVGRIGESCFVFGRLERGDAPGSYVIAGVDGGPATLLVGVSHAALRREWAARSWAYFGAAAILTALAASLLAS